MDLPAPLFDRRFLVRPVKAGQAQMAGKRETAAKLLHKPEDAENPAENGTLIDNDRFHGIILRLEAEVTVLLEKGFYCCGVVNECHNDITVSCRIAGIDEDPVAVKDTGVDHRISPYAKNKGLSGRDDLGGNGEVVHDVFLSQDGYSGSDIADLGNGDHFSADDLKAVVADLDGAGFCGIPADIAVLFEGGEMRVYRGSGAQTDRRADLPHRRRITLF